MPDSGLDERVARLEGRVEGFDDRFDGLERRIDALDARVSGRIEALDQKVSRHFTWTVGLQVAVLLAVVAALTSR